MSRPREERSESLWRMASLAKSAEKLVRNVSGYRLAAFVAAIGSVIWLSATAAFGHELSAQLLYMPILGATWAFGPVGALAAGLSAAMGGPVFGQVTSHATAQSVIYVLFSGMCAWIGSASSKSAVVSEERPRETTVSVKLAGRERVLESLARTVEVRDHHTEGHCRRVAKNAVALGRGMGLTENQLDILYWAALLHDLGKIAVPDYILLKSSRLSEDEFAEIRRHATYGADLLTSVSLSFREIADVVRAHHERWDGLGYPLGLRGEEIPRLARVIAVVDVFEALTSQRPYRKPMSSEDALKYVTHGSGTQFDPDVVGAFEQLVGAGIVECALEDDSDSLFKVSQYRSSVPASY